jgi:hypothetical protein
MDWSPYKVFLLFSKERLKTNCSLSFALILREHFAMLLILKAMILWSDHTISVHGCRSNRQIHSNLYMNVIQFVWDNIEDCQISIIPWTCLPMHIVHLTADLRWPQVLIVPYTIDMKWLAVCKVLNVAEEIQGTRTLERSGRVAIFLLSKHTASYFRLRADAIHFSAGRWLANNMSIFPSVSRHAIR